MHLNSCYVSCIAELLHFRPKLTFSRIQKRAKILKICIEKISNVLIQIKFTLVNISSKELIQQ